ncbi:TRAP transporter small permease [Devosia sp. A449]
MNKLLEFYCKGLQAIAVACLVVMVGLVFGNVVLRYAFNSGIVVAEEIARWLFVWVTFLGATFALREHAHLGTDMLVGRLGVTGKKLCFVIAYSLMLWVCWLMFSGALEQTRMNWHVSAPSSGLPVAWFYLSGVVFSVSAAAILLNDLYRVLTGRADEADLVAIKESEDLR